MSSMSFYDAQETLDQQLHSMHAPSNGGVGRVPMAASAFTGREGQARTRGRAYSSASSNLSRASSVLSTPSSASAASANSAAFSTPFATSSTIASTPETSPFGRMPGKTRLFPAPGNAGFYMQSPTGEMFDVGWEELLGLLLNPESTKLLQEQHLAKRASHFLRAQIASLGRLPAAPQASQPNLPPPPPPPPVVPRMPTVPSFAPAPVAFEAISISNESPELPKQSVPAFYRPHRSRTSSSQQTIQNQLITPLQKAFGGAALEHASPAPTTQSLATGIPRPADVAPFAFEPKTNQRMPPSTVPAPHLTTVPLPLESVSDFSASSPSWDRRSWNGPQPSSHSYREPTRRSATTSTHPYPHPPSGRPASIHSVKSVSSAHSSASTSNSVWSSSFEADWDGPDQPGKPRPLRALNGKTETYVWKAMAGQLFKSSTVLHEQPDEEDSETVVFPPGSYYKVIKEEMEILPSDGKAMNEWIRAQECVPECRFRIERKRPATIRAHFISCKLRSSLIPDPIKRLCELQTAAQKRYRPQTMLHRAGSAASNWSGLGRKRRKGEEVSDEGEDDRNRSPPSISRESPEAMMDSPVFQLARAPQPHQASTSQSYQFVQDPQAQGWALSASPALSGMYAPMEEDNYETALQVLAQDSYNPPGSPGLTNGFNTNWLTAYGLAVPQEEDANGVQPLVGMGTNPVPRARCSTSESFLDLDES